jgi:hydrogenase expression/formation protein HypD
LIEASGYKLNSDYRDHDAERLFEVGHMAARESSLCISGQILKGLKKPHDCPAFGRECTPATPLGATMVSSEGACAAYHAYGRHLGAAQLDVAVSRFVSVDQPLVSRELVTGDR